MLASLLLLIEIHRAGVRANKLVMKLTSFLRVDENTASRHLCATQQDALAKTCPRLRTTTTMPVDVSLIIMERSVTLGPSRSFVESGNEKLGASGSKQSERLQDCSNE